MPEESPATWMNAVEAWPLYDTVQIGKGIAAPLGFGSFGAIPAKMPFFNVRTEGEAGSALCNLESKDSLAFGYKLYSIGVSFRWPAGIVPPRQGENLAGVSNPDIPILFQQELPKRVALRLQIRQDDKLLSNVFLAPEGTGPYGFGLAANIDLAGASGWAYSNGIVEGMPDLKNRWSFPEPLIMPRGCTFRAYLEFDEYARGMLASWPQMPDYVFATEDAIEHKVLARATIRVSLIGKREVQQRNALHV